MLAKLYYYHNFLSFGFLARLCSLDCLQLGIMVARISPLNRDFLDYSELIIKVSLAWIPLIGVGPGYMAFVPTIKVKVVS